MRVWVLGLVACVVLLGLGTQVVSAEQDRLEPGGVDPVDEATLGERSNGTVCDDDACVEAVLENAHWRCSGTDVASFSCNVSFWLNLTVRGQHVCASGDINRTDELAPSVCTGEVPVAHEVGGPVVLEFDAGGSGRMVNVSAEVCLGTGSSSEVCEAWGHDPVLLPGWEEWRGGVLSTVLEDKQVCLGDSAGFQSPGDAGPGCASGLIQAFSECTGLKENYRCVVTVRLLVGAHGSGVCGSVSTEFGEGTSARTCSFRHEEAGSRVKESTEVSRVYEHDEIPREGRTVVIEAELCAWSFRPFAEEFCGTFNSTWYLGGDPCACNGGPVDSVRDVVKGSATYLVTTASHVDPPSVHP